MLIRTVWDARVCKVGQEPSSTSNCLALLRADRPRATVQHLHRPAEVGLGRAMGMAAGADSDLDSGTASNSIGRKAESRIWKGLCAPREGLFVDVPQRHGEGSHKRQTPTMKGRLQSWPNVLHCTKYFSRFLMFTRDVCGCRCRMRATAHTLGTASSSCPRPGLSDWGSGDDGDTAAFEALLEEEARFVRRRHGRASPLPSSPSTSSLHDHSPRRSRRVGGRPRSISAVPR